MTSHCLGCLGGTESDSSPPVQPWGATALGTLLLIAGKMADRRDTDMRMASNASYAVGSLVIAGKWWMYRNAVAAQEAEVAVGFQESSLGSSESDELVRQGRGMGAVGIGIVGAALGAVLGAQLSTPRIPLTWPLGLAGFILPLIAFAPKTDDAA